jgi:DNA-binding transcriptional ArsR family regulator
VEPLELLLHPIRLRIVHAMSGGRTRTTSDLCAALPDVPKTTLYRHVGLLVDGKVLEVAEERRVHGAVERLYRLRGDRAVIDTEVAGSMALDDHRRGFTAAMAALLAEFDAYLGREGADPTTDQVGYRQGVLWLSPEELAETGQELLALLRPRSGNGPAPGRRPHLVSAIVFPTGEPAG